MVAHGLRPTLVLNMKAVATGGLCGHAFFYEVVV